VTTTTPTTTPVATEEPPAEVTTTPEEQPTTPTAAPGPTDGFPFVIVGIVAAAILLAVAIALRLR
jgi:hypothetical protein